MASREGDGIIGLSSVRLRALPIPHLKTDKNTVVCIAKVAEDEEEVSEAVGVDVAIEEKEKKVHSNGNFRYQFPQL